MKVKELIEALREYDEDRVVLISRDPEGNGFGELHSLATAMYDGDSIGLESLTEEDKKAGYSEEDVMTEGDLCVVLWP